MCSAMDLSYDGFLVICRNCEWSDTVPGTLTEFMEVTGSRHITDWPAGKIGKFRVIERLIKESL